MGRVSAEPNAGVCFEARNLRIDSLATTVSCAAGWLDGLFDPSSDEASLVSIAIPSLASVLALRQPTCVLREVRIGRVIADILFASPSRMSPAPIEHLTAHECAILSALRRLGHTRIDLLERRAGLPHGGLRAGALDRLLELKLLRRGRGGQVKASPQWAMRAQLVAIEAKLRRWRDALSQAVEYKRFADKSYVLLPELHAEVAMRHLDAFEDSEVGLVVYGDYGVRVVLETSVQRDHDWRREYVVSRVFQ